MSDTNTDTDTNATPELIPESYTNPDCMSTTPKAPTVEDGALEPLLHQLNAVDSVFAQLAIDLKDPTKRQAIGANILRVFTDMQASGGEFSDIKIKIKSGVATVSFKAPVSAMISAERSIL